MKRILLTGFLCITLILSSRAQWESQPLGFSTPVMVYEMEAVNTHVVWAAGSDTIHIPGQIFVKSIDGGQNWQSGPVNNSLDYIINSITAIDATTAWVAMVADTSMNGGMIKKTSDGGLNWVTQGTNAFTDPASYPDVIHFFDANKGVVFGDPVEGYWEVYATSDGGNTWMRLPAESLPDVRSTNMYDEYGMFAKATVGDNIWVGTSEGRIFRSVDRGLTWTAAHTSLTEVQAIAFTDAMNGLAMSRYGELVTTSNGGATWTNVNYQGNVFDYDMAALPQVPGSFVSTGFDQYGFMGSSYTTDGGLNWITLDSLPHMAVAFASAEVGWTSGANSRAAYIWSGTSPLGLEETVAVQESKVYPNPSTGSFYLNQKDLIQRLTVTDYSGKQVFVAENVAPDHMLNLSHLPKGVYVIQLTIAKTVNSQRLVLQ